MAHPILGPSPTLPEIQVYIREMVRYRKFDETDVQYKLLLLVEELGELAKAIRQETNGKFAADTTRTNVLHEAADVFIVFTGLCNMLNIDIEQALRDKEEINKFRTWK